MGCCASGNNNGRNVRPHYYQNDGEAPPPVTPSKEQDISESIIDIPADDPHHLFQLFPLNPAKITNDYRISPTVLGKGAFGVVRKCTHLITGQERAIKIIVKDDFVKDKTRSIQYINEIEIMKSLTHPNLVGIYEYFQDEQYVFIVMELVRGIELLDKILKAGRLSENETCIIMEQIVNALNYMHSNGIVHRDIKPENVLVDGKNIKLIDFGGARRFKPDRLMKKLSGTPFYIAPEVLGQAYDERCDVWSLGVIMYIMLTGEPPFPGKTDDVIFENVRRGRVNFNHAAILLASENARDLLRKLLFYNYKQRVRMSEIINHPWFQALRANVTPLAGDIMDNLKRFSVGSSLQKAIYFYLINNVASNVEKEKLIVAFGQLDLNHDGVLSKEEINIGLEKVGIRLSGVDLQEVMNRVGGPGVQTINYIEFLAATLDRRSLLNESRIEQCFKQFDQDKTGKISINNFRAMLGNRANMTDAQWYELIKVYDLNGDGVIEYSEFREILIKLASG